MSVNKFMLMMGVHMSFIRDTVSWNRYFLLQAHKLSSSPITDRMNNKETFLIPSPKPFLSQPVDKSPNQNKAPKPALAKPHKLECFQTTSCSIQNYQNFRNNRNGKNKIKTSQKQYITNEDPSIMPTSRVISTIKIDWTET